MLSCIRIGCLADFLDVFIIGATSRLKRTRFIRGLADIQTDRIRLTRLSCDLDVSIRFVFSSESSY